MTLHGRSLIAGAQAATGGRTFHAMDPARGAKIEPEFHEAVDGDVERAMDAAAAAFEVYRQRPAIDRAVLLERIATEIEALGEQLVERAAAETGLPAVRLTGERGRTCTQLRMFAALVREGSWVDARIDTALPERSPLPRPDLRRMLLPLGPVVVFGSSNFPLAFSTAGGDTASALAAGCPVVVKAHRAHPGTGELVAGAIDRAIAACGLPAGLFSMLHGPGQTVGISLVQHPATTAVGFTGSHAAGRALYDAAARRPDPIPVFAEMSSINPVFLLPGALRARGAALARGLVDSFTLGVGQFCTKPGLVFVPAGEATEEFLAELRRLVEAAPCGTLLSEEIRSGFEASRARITGSGAVRPLAQSRHEVAPGRVAALPGLSVTSARELMSTPALATEAFGPFTLVVRADDLDAMQACLRALPGQLTATVHGTDEDLAAARPLLDLATRRAGRVLINGFPTGVEVCAAMNHGGPWPATSDARFTSVGTAALLRFARPVCYQGFADTLLPPELQDANPRGILRLVDGEATRAPVKRR